MFNELSISDIIGLVTVVVGGLAMIVGAIVKFTASKKDDEVFENVQEVIDPLLEALNKKSPKP